MLWVSRAILPGMIARGTGHVVNLGSTAGRWVYPRGNVYNATKFGVRALTEAMNLDVAGTGIRVSGVEPGHTETEFAEVRFAGDRERAKATYRGFTPLTGDDVADVIAYVVNLPPHVNILNVLIMPSAQRSIACDRPKRLAVGRWQMADGRWQRHRPSRLAPSRITFSGASNRRSVPWFAARRCCLVPVSRSFPAIC
jgi:hypothetical protein